MSLTIEDVKPKLHSLDYVREVLASTEPLSALGFPVGTGVQFRVQDSFNHGIEAKTGEAVLDGAYVTVAGQEYPLSKDALLEATSAVGLGKGYVQRTPGKYVEDQLNYWFRGGLGDKEFKILTVQDRAAALTRAAVQPYSNLRLLEVMLDKIEDRYGKGEVLADYKFHHDLQRTHLRLIVPEHTRVIENTGTDNDTWSVGINFKNSLIGLEQTEFSGYLFRYWCTNGSIDTRGDSGVWSRRGDRGQSDEVYEWAATVVDDVLGGLEGALDNVQALTEVPVDGEAVDVLREIFTEYRVPNPQRRAITDAMVNESRLTAYTVMQAVTQAANAADLDPVNADRLMRVGGELPNKVHQRCSLGQIHLTDADHDH